MRTQPRSVGPAGIIGAGRSWTAWMISVLSIPRRYAEVIPRSACPSWRCMTSSGIPSRDISTAWACRSWWGAKRRLTPAASPVRWSWARMAGRGAWPPAGETSPGGSPRYRAALPLIARLASERAWRYRAMCELEVGWMPAGGSRFPSARRATTCKGCSDTSPGARTDPRCSPFEAPGSD